MAGEADCLIRIYDPGDENAVISLWQECALVVPWNDPVSDINRKLADSPELFFVADANGYIVGTCMAGYDGHRGWIYYLAVAESCRREGIARRLVTHAERVLVERGCPKLELMVRESNADAIKFYERTGFRKESVQVLSKRLIEDAPHVYAR